MREDIIVMAKREVERLKVIGKVMDKQITQVKASELLGICERQVRRCKKQVHQWRERKA